MKNIIKLTTLTLLILHFTSENLIAQCHIEDWNALRQLYLNTNGDNWRNNAGWQEVTNNTPSANCNLDLMQGVWLDYQGRVDNLNLTNNQLNGSVPSELGNLANLKSLYLTGNQLNGGIPPNWVI